MQQLFDTQLIIERRRRALRQAVPGADFLLARVADDLAERLSVIERRFERAAVLFPASALPVEALAMSGKVGEIVRVEAHPELLQGAPGLVATPETVPFEPASLDLAVSLMALQDANDLPGMLVQVRRALRPDGLLLAAFAGAGTLAELRDSLLAAETEVSGGASPRVSPFTDVRDAGALLQRAGFALPVADLEPLTVRYGGLPALVRDLRAMGATNALLDRSRKPASRALLVRADAIYRGRHADADGRIRATFNIVWMSGWVPHASQQKPLKPGSATMRLSEALKRSGGE
ncbi:MAG: methyltransferase domain-containing protein [Rhizobiaceae bacterium]